MAEAKKTTTKKTTAKNSIKDAEEPMKIKSNKKSFKELRKLLHRDTEVLIMNNTQGNFFYRCPKTNTEIDMSEFGDTEVVTLELLEAMKNKGKKLLKNFFVIIVDVYPEAELEEEINISDVLLYLGLDDLYKPISEELEYEEEIYSEEFFDNLIINKDRDDFNKLVDKFNKQLLVQLAKRSVHLYEIGEFDSRYKMDKLQEKLGIKDLFSDL